MLTSPGPQNKFQDDFCTQYLFSKVNPFAAEATGVRAPDQFSYPTGTGVLRNALTATSTGSGYVVSAALPFPFAYLFNPASITGGTVTWSGGSTVATSQANTLTNVASVARVVSWGIRISPEPSFSNISGHLWVVHVPINESQSTWPVYDWPTTEAGFASMPMAEKWSLTEIAQKPLLVSGRSFDDGIYRFRDVNEPAAALGNNSLENTRGWCGIGIYATGLANTTAVLNIEHIMHIEYIQDGSTLYDFVDTRPGHYSADEMSKAVDLQNGMPVAYLEEAVTTVERSANFISGAINRGLSLATAGARMATTVGRLYNAVTGWNRPARALPWVEEVD